MNSAVCYQKILYIQCIWQYCRLTHLDPQGQFHQLECNTNVDMLTHTVKGDSCTQNRSQVRDRCHLPCTGSGCRDPLGTNKQNFHQSPWQLVSVTALHINHDVCLKTCSSIVHDPSIGPFQSQYPFGSAAWTRICVHCKILRFACIWV